MKRSEINQEIEKAKQFFEEMNWKLPGWAHFSPNVWQEIMSDSHLREEYADVVKAGLGWDVTDFGSGEFSREGLLLFTMRNGELGTSREYAEKIMVVGEGQVTPWHYHWAKAEDIINRGGGNLVIELYMASKLDNPPPGEKWTQGKFSRDTQVYVSIDGVVNSVQPGDKVILEPGQSITLMPRVYHNFYGQDGKGTVLVGEVSRVNDDRGDNRFYHQLPRFTPIVEDAKPVHLLCNEYGKVDGLLGK